MTGHTPLDRLVAWIQRTDRPDEVDPRQLLVPHLDPGTLAFGPNIPVLGYTQFVELSNGLVTLDFTRTSAADYWKGFLTASDYMGQPIPLDRLRSYLNEYPVTTLVAMLAALNCTMEARGLLHRATSRELLEGCTPADIASSIRHFIDSDERSFTSPQVVLTLAKLALLDAAEGTDVIAPARLGPALLAAADHVGGRISREHPDWPLEIARYKLFYSRDTFISIWGRFSELWLRILPSMSSHNNFVDFRSILQADVGVPFEDYVALGVGLALMYNDRVTNAREGPWFQTAVAGTGLTDETVASVVDYLAGDRDWFQQRLDVEALYWDFTPFRTKPLFRHGSLMTPFSLQFLVERPTEGIYYSVLDYLSRTEGQSGVDAWGQFFGDGWEIYVRNLIAVTVGTGSIGRLIEEERLKELWKDRKTCDNLILYPERWLLVESVAKRMTIGTVATGGLIDFEKDLAAAVTKKARQLASTVDLLINDAERLSVPGWTGEERFSPTIVLPGPYPRIPPVTEHVAELVAADDECAALADPRVYPLIILSAGDFEALLGTSEGSGVSVVQLLHDWQRSADSLADFTSWAATEPGVTLMRPQWLTSAAHDFMSDCIKTLFRTNRLNGSASGSP